MKIILIAVSLLLLCASPSLAQRYDCSFGTSTCEAYANADAVFVGKVTRIFPQTIQIWQRDKDYDQTTHILVEKTFKGVSRSRLVLHQLGVKSAPKFILNSRYLFYANFDRATRQWEVRFCGRTRMANYAQNDLAYLNSLPASVNKTRIAGEVTQYDTDDENPQGITKRLAGIKIRIKGEGKEYEVITDANGVYELYDAPAGNYILDPVIPAGLKLMFVIHPGPLARSKLQSLKFELKERSCSGLDILLTSDPTHEKRSIGNQ